MSNTAAAVLYDAFRNYQGQIQKNQSLIPYGPSSRPRQCETKQLSCWWVQSATCCSGLFSHPDTRSGEATEMPWNVAWCSDTARLHWTFQSFPALASSLVQKEVCVQCRRWVFLYLTGFSALRSNSLGPQVNYLCFKLAGLKAPHNIILATEGR